MDFSKLTVQELLDYVSLIAPETFGQEFSSLEEWAKSVYESNSGRKVTAPVADLILASSLWEKDLNIYLAASHIENFTGEKLEEYASMLGITRGTPEEKKMRMRRVLRILGKLNDDLAPSKAIDIYNLTFKEKLEKFNATDSKVDDINQAALDGRILEEKASKGELDWKLLREDMFKLLQYWMAFHAILNRRVTLDAFGSRAKIGDYSTEVADIGVMYLNTSGNIDAEGGFKEVSLRELKDASPTLEAGDKAVVWVKTTKGEHLWLLVTVPLNFETFTDYRYNADLTDQIERFLVKDDFILYMRSLLNAKGSDYFENIIGVPQSLADDILEVDAAFGDDTLADSISEGRDIGDVVFHKGTTHLTGLARVLELNPSTFELAATTKLVDQPHLVNFYLNRTLFPDKTYPEIFDESLMEALGYEEGKGGEKEEEDEMDFYGQFFNPILEEMDEMRNDAMKRREANLRRTSSLKPVDNLRRTIEDLREEGVNVADVDAQLKVSNNFPLRNEFRHGWPLKRLQAAVAKEYNMESYARGHGKVKFFYRRQLGLDDSYPEKIYTPFIVFTNYRGGLNYNEKFPIEFWEMMYRLLFLRDSQKEKIVTYLDYEKIKGEDENEEERAKRMKEKEEREIEIAKAREERIQRQLEKRYGSRLPMPSYTPSMPSYTPGMTFGGRLMYPPGNVGAPEPFKPMLSPTLNRMQESKVVLPLQAPSQSPLQRPVSPSQTSIPTSQTLQGGPLPQTAVSPSVGGFLRPVSPTRNTGSITTISPSGAKFVRTVQEGVTPVTGTPYLEHQRKEKNEAPQIFFSYAGLKNYGDLLVNRPLENTNPTTFWWADPADPANPGALIKYPDNLQQIFNDGFQKDGYLESFEGGNKEIIGRFGAPDNFMWLHVKNGVGYRMYPPKGTPFSKI